jgi:DNA repair exonuclease SbcCD ATPase subunit
VRLLSLTVEHFRCIRKASLDFAPGLNILFGPNDLGKSSLVRAMRAALLLQHNSKDHEEFIAWDGSGDPSVQLVFEAEPQRIYRVRKQFGSNGSSFLDESRNGFDFTNECRGRDVDGRLREILRWGIAPPGKGASKGMPWSFLSTALFAEQDEVNAIFEHALGGDSDETGKKRLSEVLQAMAEDPLFRNVLAKAQQRVDEAFNKNGAKKTGKNSPWTRLREAIRQADEQNRRCQGELQTTEALEAELEELLNEKLQCRERVEEAETVLGKLEADFERQQQREQILVRLNECNGRLLEIRNELGALAAAEKRQLDLAEQVLKLQNTEQVSKAALEEAHAKVKAAEDALTELHREDRVRERLLKKSTLETRKAELGSEQERNRSALNRVSLIEAAKRKFESLDQEIQSLPKSLTELQTLHNAAVKAVRDSDTEQREMTAIAQLLRLKEAEQAVIQINRWREEASHKRAEAAALESTIPALPLPDATKLNTLRRLEGDVRVAAGKLDVGLAVTVRPKRDIQLKVQRDGARPEQHELADAAFETSAHRQIRLDIEGIAEIAVSGGAEDARQQLERLESRWQTEALPLLNAAGVTTVEQLTEIAEDTVRKVRDLQSARQAADQLDQRIADQPDWDKVLSERTETYQAAEKQLEGADRGDLEKRAQTLNLRDAAAVEKRRDTLRAKHSNLISATNELATRLAGDRAKLAEKQQSLEAARQDLVQAQTGLEDWQERKQAILIRQDQIAGELSSIETQLESMAAAEDRSVDDAKKVLEQRKQELSAAQGAHQKATEDMNRLREEKAAHEGALKILRESANKLDETEARNVIAQVETELASHPAPDPSVTEERLAEVRQAAEHAHAALKNIEDEIHAKRGALQQVGGDVSKQRAAEATAQLDTAKQREREAELDFNAWELLRQALREAEQEESSHLGRLLAGPIESRFSELTSRRYTKLALGPALEMQGVFVAGRDRDVSLLSVGTKDQLSTVLRLTIAEQLKSAIVLDDQLTQSDESRMQWLHDFLRQMAANIQVIVFTCRPETYFRNGTAHSAVRLLDLTGVIETSPGTPTHLCK